MRVQRRVGSNRVVPVRVRRIVTMSSVAAVALVAGLQGSSMAAAQHQHPGRGHHHSPHFLAAQAARAEYAKFHKKQAGLDIPVLASAPPSGKRLMVSTCPVAVCHLTTDPAVASAKKLGWTVEEVELPLTGAQPVIDFWKKVLVELPDAVVYEGTVPDAQVQSYIDQAGAAGIKIVDAAPKGTVISPNGPIYAQVNGPGVLALSGRLMGDAVVTSSRHKHAHSVWITDPTRAFFNPAQAAFTAVLTATGGSVDTLGIALADVGVGVPGAVVSYVKAHPHVRYLAFALNDMTAGVPEALKQAGLGKRVKIISRAASPAGIKDIQTGKQWASVTEEVESAGWRNVDQLVRVLTGVPMSTDLSDPVGWHMIIDESNVGAAANGPQVPGFPSAFLRAWHLPTS